MFVVSFSFSIIGQSVQIRNDINNSLKSLVHHVRGLLQIRGSMRLCTALFPFIGIIAGVWPLKRIGQRVRSPAGPLCCVLWSQCIEKPPAVYDLAAEGVLIAQDRQRGPPAKLKKILAFPSMD